jgi:hypothetical protein
MIKALKTIRKRLLPDKALLDTGYPTGANVLTEIKLHSSLHRLMEQRIRCTTLREQRD